MRACVIGKAVWGSIRRQRAARPAVACGGALWMLFAGAGLAMAQTTAAPTPATSGPAAVAVPPDYVIGPEDVLSIVFWRDKDMSADVVVRPDGKISLPLLNDVQAGGLAPEQLRAALAAAAAKFIADPNATVVVKEIHSRKVYITGNVAKPGTYPLAGDMNVLQLIALSGGLAEYADAKNIVVMRNEGGEMRAFKFNYKDVVKQKNVRQNILLTRGDTVVVP
ncbi:MAG: polysaccharide biosynthesis/export family protein [Mycobacteriales bacterium]